MSGWDWQAFDAELRARAQELAVELLGNPSLRAGQEWRWGRMYRAEPGAQRAQADALEAGSPTDKTRQRNEALDLRKAG